MMTTVTDTGDCPHRSTTAAPTMPCSHHVPCPQASADDHLCPPAIRGTPPEMPNYQGISSRAAEADARTRTGDPFITSEVLYQLSYVGAGCGV
jgi:hypothetical protein